MNTNYIELYIKETPSDKNDGDPILFDLPGLTGTRKNISDKELLECKQNYNYCLGLFKQAISRLDDPATQEEDRKRIKDNIEYYLEEMFRYLIVIRTYTQDEMMAGFVLEPDTHE